MAISDSEFDELAKAPKKVVGEEGSVEERDLDELLEAKRHTDNNAITGAPYGAHVARVKPMGTVQ